MKLLAVFAFVPIVAAFAPSKMVCKETQLSMVSRRDACFGIAGTTAAIFGAPAATQASTGNPFFEAEVNFQPQQMVTGDKVDVNGAIVVDYQQFPGMYPHAAGKIASNGPYATVKDIYKISGITDNDKVVFQKYEKMLTALPPGRMFDERINQRQST
mmetsp:Transcript_974/g.1228  ORF Transcript_974/g.1228 Transcript_974/m.1228 type:complete len:157 (+) Transcript_974:304-774(+)|eukprot:CAMPEP_0195251800 /NCGR_PEP_ID=MMETSP0706-20130129/3500_1 /TAXON_ID=33640 /ORGANISM="Asterionellopsis glacialis, Strain CCMP134" /LENGTH=156 /DNA_ID=CAMNT_0040304009 /DNA_START=167 /DNA_END=637 /DNA_ORIENTATION=-